MAGRLWLILEPAGRAFLGVCGLLHGRPGQKKVVFSWTWVVLPASLVPHEYFQCTLVAIWRLFGRISTHILICFLQILSIYGAHTKLYAECLGTPQMHTYSTTCVRM